MTVLETKNLFKHFDGVRALNDLSLEIEAGKIIGLVGPNGSGKSTLINVLTGVFKSDGGMFVIDGLTLKKISPWEIRFFGLARTFQEVRLFNQMSVLDNLLFVLTERNVFASLFEKHGKWHLEKAEEILRCVELWEKRNEKAENLSYGQRKLLEIGRALGMDAKIIFFDEPFAGLSPRMIKVVSGLIRKLKESGKTIILVEHNLELIRELSDRVIVLDSGELLAEGDPQKVFNMEKVIDAYVGK